MNIQDIKKLFFTYRNGVVADTLRRSGMPYRMIYGVEVPILSRISKEIGYDNGLATQLWSEKDVRESRLLASYLFDPETVTMELSLSLCSEVQTHEEADMLTFRLLKRLPYSRELLELLKKDDKMKVIYSSLAKYHG